MLVKYCLVMQNSISTNVINYFDTSFTVNSQNLNFSGVSMHNIDVT